jgi:glycosyltransferase involved in cell wall biosynthesis
MLFIGSGKDEEKLEEKILDYNLENEVIMVGKIMGRENISCYYALADLFLFPSLYDASSLVQIEAASQRTPALFLEGAATADTVAANVNGYLSKNDSTAYANKIIDIFSNQLHHKTVCDNAFKDLYKTWDEVVSITYKEYQELVMINLKNKIKKR